jgi:hypothetical protein
MAICVYNNYKSTLVSCDDTMGEMSTAITCNYVSSRNFSYLNNNNNNSIIKNMNVYTHEWNMLQFRDMCQGSLGPAG